jgi:hypothetical protein
MLSFLPFILSSAEHMKSFVFFDLQCFRTHASFQWDRTACLGVTREALFHGSESKSTSGQDGDPMICFRNISRSVFRT